MPPTRVFLTGMPLMLRDVVRAVVEGIPDFLVVGEGQKFDVRTIVDAAPDVVLASAEDVTETDAVQLLCALTGLGTRYELRVARVPLGELGLASFTSLLSAPRDVGANDEGDSR